MKNKRYTMAEEDIKRLQTIVEAMSVNAEGQIEEDAFNLEEALDSAIKAENAANNMLTMAAKSKIKEFHSLVGKYKSLASEIVQMLSRLMMKGEGGVQADSDERIRLDAPDAETNSIEQQAQPQLQKQESAKDRYNKRKIKEAEEIADDNEVAKESPTKPATEVTPPPTAPEKPEALGAEPNTTPDIAPNQNSGEAVIDLSEPFARVLDGLEPDEFQQFKTDVVAKLEGAIDMVEQKTDPTAADEFTKSIQAISATNSGQDFDMAMNQIYDFADANDIIVETVKVVKKALPNKKKK
jgi:hypothetical protein